METGFSITKDSKQKDEMHLSDAFQHSIKVPKDSDMYKFMSKFNDGRISFSDIKSIMDSKEYKAVKDKFEFKTYKNEFLISDLIDFIPLFFNYYTCQESDEIPHEYYNRMINLFNLEAHYDIDFDTTECAIKRISDHSKFKLFPNVHGGYYQNEYYACVEMNNYEDVGGLLMISFDADVDIVRLQDMSVVINVTELIIKI